MKMERRELKLAERERRSDEIRREKKSREETERRERRIKCVICRCCEEGWEQRNDAKGWAKGREKNEDWNWATKRERVEEMIRCLMSSCIDAFAVRKKELES